MITKTIAAVALTLASSAALAGDFDGPYVAVAAGLANNQAEGTWSGISGWGGTDPYLYTFEDQLSSLGDDGLEGQVSAGYTMSIGSKFSLGGGVFYNFGQDCAGDFASADTNRPGEATWYDAWEIKTELTSVWGVSIEPGLYIGDKTLAYVKLGYSQAKLGLAGAFAVGEPALGYAESGSDSASKTVDGFVFGWGLKHLVTDKLFVGVEVSQTQYGGTKVSMGTEVIDLETKQSLGMISVGYQF